MRNKAFTLVELLVVIGIISILALIALPNSQEAQARAKVAAAKNNLRVMAMNIEMCATDTNRYPRAITWNLPCKLIFSADNMTTPVFTRQLDLFLPFKTANPDLPFGDLVYFHHPTMLEVLEQGVSWDEATTETWARAYAMAGEWSLHSIGPDCVLQGPNWVRMAGTVSTRCTRWCDNPTSPGGPGPCDSLPHEYTDWAYFRDYDPTNGTVSEGNVFRTQRSSAGFGVDPYFYRQEGGS